MPEAFTYFDMARRLSVAFPNPERFHLRIFEENGRYSGIGDATKLTRSAKMKAREQDRANFRPNVEASFPGLEDLPLRIRNGTQEFSLCGDQIKSRGKALGIPITEGWWMNIQLLMHGHVLTISSKQLTQLIEARSDFVSSGGLDSKGRQHEEGAITIQLALINTNPDGNCIIVVDRIRLTIISFVEVSQPDIVWYSKKQGPCPITEADRWSTKFDLFNPPTKNEHSIFKTLTQRQDFFNGIGTSHANEILHLAWEHPAQKASVIFRAPARRQKLKAAIEQFFNFAHSARYQTAVPSGRSGGSAFAEPAYITKNIISLQQRVYGHTASPTKISKEHYKDLFDRGLLDNRYPALGTSKQGRRERDSAQNAKKVDVYAIRFLTIQKKDDDTGASDPDAPKEPKRGQFAYTVMCKTPPGCVAVEYQSYDIARRRALGSRDAEIGIASFVDNAPLRHFESEAFQRRFPVRTGARGRPRKSKAAKREKSLTRNLLASSVQVGASSDAPLTSDDVPDDLQASLQMETMDELTEFGETEELEQSDDIVADIPQHAEEIEADIDVESVDENDDDDDTVPDTVDVVEVEQSTGGGGGDDDDDDDDDEFHERERRRQEKGKGRADDTPLGPSSAAAAAAAAPPGMGMLDLIRDKSPVKKHGRPAPMSNTAFNDFVAKWKETEMRKAASKKELEDQREGD